MGIRITDLLSREGLLDDQEVHFFGAKPYFNYTRLTPYEGLIRLSSSKQAFEFAEAMKARQMIERAARREAGRDVKVSPELQAKERETKLVISNLNNRKEAATKRNDKKELARIEPALQAARLKRTNLS